MSNESNSNTDFDRDSSIILEEEIKTKKPRMFMVLLHNDDYTTMEFVVEVLKKYFNKSKADATAIMLEVHTKGFGICGIYTKEVAESKSLKVVRHAREAGHPLKCSYEPV